MVHKHLNYYAYLIILKNLLEMEEALKFCNPMIFRIYIFPNPRLLRRYLRVFH